MTSLSVCDYSGNILMDLYHSESPANGQAFDIQIIKERNGWKEVTFSLPLEIETDEGIRRNHRLDCIQNERMLRIVEDGYEDFYFIAQPDWANSGGKKSISVYCGHVSSI